MILLVEELVTELAQGVKSTSGVRNVRHVRPHLFRKGAPAGTLKVEIRDSSGGLIATSPTVAISAIGTLTYAHGYVKFDVTAQLAPGVTYQIALVPGGGYTFAESDWIGWCNGYDLGKYPPIVPVSGSLNQPLDMEIWEFKQVFKGA